MWSNIFFKPLPTTKHVFRIGIDQPQCFFFLTSKNAMWTESKQQRWDWNASTGWKASQASPSKWPTWDVKEQYDMQYADIPPKIEHLWTTNDYIEGHLASYSRLMARKTSCRIGGWIALGWVLRYVNSHSQEVFPSNKKSYPAPRWKAISPPAILRAMEISSKIFPKTMGCFKCFHPLFTSICMQDVQWNPFRIPPIANSDLERFGLYMHYSPDSMNSFPSTSSLFTSSCIQDCPTRSLAYDSFATFKRAWWNMSQVLLAILLSLNSLFWSFGWCWKQICHCQTAPFLLSRWSCARKLWAARGLKGAAWDWDSREGVHGNSNHQAKPPVAVSVGWANGLIFPCHTVESRMIQLRFWHRMI